MIKRKECLTPTPTVSAPTPAATPQAGLNPISPTPAAAQAPPSTAPPAPAPPVPPPRNCSEWPGEVAAVLQKLPTPQGLCLVTDGSLGCPAGAAACYSPAVRIAVLVFDGSRTAQVHAITHEVCHTHQHFVVLQAGLPQWPLEPGWRQTPPGAAFQDLGSEPWPTGWVAPSLLEDMAETCVAWYGTGLYEPGILDGMPKHRRWARSGCRSKPRGCYNRRPAMIESHPWQAHAIRAVPALLLAGCVVRAVAIFLAWDPDTDLEPWVGTATGLEPSLPVGLVALLCLRVVWRRTAGSFSVIPLQLASGAVLLTAAAVFALASRETALHEAGPGFRAPDNVADWGMLAVLVAASLAVVLLLAGICYLYAQSITPESSVKWDRRPGERDAMGEIIRGQPR